MTIWVDYSGGEIPVSALQAAGVGGGVRYGGTPGRTKNMQPGDVAQMLAAGIQQAVVYEDTAQDALAGYAAGVAHAQALLADCQRCAVPNTTPLCAAADEYLTAAQVSVSVQYQAGFYRTVKASGWAGPVGAYGFAEFTTAVRAAGVTDWFWQCGAYSAVASWVHLYQRNGSGGPTPNITTSGVIGAVEVDFNDQLNPLPTAGTPRRGNSMAVFLKNLDKPGEYATQDGPLVTGVREEVGAATLKAWPGAACEIGLNDAEFQDRVNKSKVLEQLGASIGALTAAVQAAPVPTLDPAAVGQALAAAEGPAIVQAFTTALASLPTELAGQILEQGAAAITKAGA